MLSIHEFNVLLFIYKHGVKTQRTIADRLACSLGTINKTVKGLQASHLIDHEGLTEAGRAALDFYKIDNAIILAAGMSSRFMPLSLENPKGLLSVKGEPLIERQIKQLHESGITDIVIVVGYMKEKYFYLEERYGVTIVVNPEYSTKNNTSSLVLVLDKLGNTYICASDHYFTENIFASHSYRTNYTAKFIYGTTTDYSYSLDAAGNFKSMRTFSENELGLVGPACFLREDARTFADYLAKRYQSPDAAGMLWEQVLIDCLDQIKMCPRVFGDGVIYEFDNLEELREFDDYYINNLSTRIIRNICDVLDCAPCDLHGFEPIRAGLTNQSFRFTCKGEHYLYRHPGKGAGAFVSRACEAEAEKVAARLGLDETVVAIDPVEGWKICRFIEDCAYIDPYDSTKDQLEAIRMLKKLHDAKGTSGHDFSFVARSQEYIDTLTKDLAYDFGPFEQEHREMRELSARIDEEGFERVLCHNDTWFWNFLKDKAGNITLIDWEYAGDNYPASDIADYTISLDFTDEQYLELARLYEGRDLTERETRFYIASLALCAWHWFVWAILQEANGITVDDMQMWHRKASRNLKAARKLYELD